MEPKDSSVYKTLRHIETVRNYLNRIITEILARQEIHDQSKLQPPEVDIFDIYTNKLRDTTYNSDEYKQYLEEMKPALEHHNATNRHHPDHFLYGIKDMNLIDIIEMLCDWKAASLRHNDGNILKSIDVNQQRFGYSDELKQVLKNTAMWLDSQIVYHKANES